MSWIQCKCSHILPDNTDRISYKGYVISDKELFDMFDLADEMIESTNPDREELCMSFRRKMGGYIKLKYIFQCPECGRILLEDNLNEFYSFLPEDSVNKRLLDFESNKDSD